MKWKIPNLLYSKVMNRLVPSESFSSNLKNNRGKKKKERKKQLFILPPRRVSTGIVIFNKKIQIFMPEGLRFVETQEL